jgi:hypothetical protein
MPLLQCINNISISKQLNVGISIKHPGKDKILQRVQKTIDITY